MARSSLDSTRLGRPFGVSLMVVLLTACAGSSVHLQSFDAVWHTVNNEFYDPGFNGIDWRAAYERYRAKLIAEDSEDGFYQHANEMLFELNRSHLLAMRRSDVKRGMPHVFGTGTVGLDLRLVNGEAVVTRIEPGGPAARAGVRLGDKVRQIDELTVAEISREAQAFLIPPFNERNRINRVTNEILSHVYGAPETNVYLHVQSAMGILRALALRRVSRGPGRIYVEALPPFYLEFEARSVGPGIGYIRLNHFIEPLGERFVQQMKRWSDLKGLVIDLRGTPGGYFTVADKIAEGLLRQRRSFASYRLRARTADRMLTPAEDSFGGPVVILIDRLSLSTAEYFAGGMQAIGRATIVGERSPGYLLGARWERLPNGGSFMVAFVDPVMSDGTVVENRGVIPDVEIARDPLQLAAGRDNQLEAAVDALKASPPRKD